MLTSLTLSADISMMPQSFSWSVNTLATRFQPSRIETIKFMLLTKEFGFAKHLPWQNLDTLFAPYPWAQWPHLNRFLVQHFPENKESIKRYKKGGLKDIILPMTPILFAADLLHFTVSGEYLRFWRL